jgi:hypothetical protein
MPRVLPRLAAAFPASRWPAPTLPTLRRRRPSSHAPRRCCQLQLARVVPLLALRHAQQLLPDLLNTRKDSFSTATFPPKLTLSPDSRRHSWPPSTAAHTASEPDPVLPEHRRDPLVLLSPSNFVFPHRSTIPRSASELQFHRRSASPSPRRYRASSPQPRAPAAPHQPVEAL